MASTIGGLTPHLTRSSLEFSMDDNKAMQCASPCSAANEDGGRKAEETARQSRESCVLAIAPLAAFAARVQSTCNSIAQLNFVPLLLAVPPQLPYAGMAFLEGLDDRFGC